jgi:hypothetical protein
MYKTRMWISFSKMTSEFPEFRWKYDNNCARPNQL